MNIENVLKLAEHMESLKPEEYDQRYISHPRPECGTPACIAGHAAWLAGRWRDPEEPNVLFVARDWLGITTVETSSLFHQKPYGEGDWLPKPKDAAWTLRHLAETGEVVWRHRYEDFAQPTD